MRPDPSLVSGRFGNRRAFSGGAGIYAMGAVLCACAPSIGVVIAGRFVQGLGGGLLSALAYVLVRNAFAEAFWTRVFGLLAGVWSVTVLVGPLIGGVFASYGHWRSAFVTVAGTGFSDWEANPRKETRKDVARNLVFIA